MIASRAVALKLVVEGAARSSSVVIFPLLARQIGASGYGAYTQAFVLVGFLAPVASLGLGHAIGRFTSQGPWTTERWRGLRQAKTLVLLTSSCIAAGIAVFANRINELFLGWERGRELFFWASPLIMLTALEGVVLEVLRARDRFGIYIAYQAFQTASLIGAVLVLVVADLSLIALIQLVVVTRLLAILATLIYLARMPTTPGSTAAFQLGEMILYGLPLIAVGFGLWFVNLADRFVIGYFLEPASVGRYAAAYAIASLQLVISAALFLPAYPRIVRLSLEGDPEQLAGEIRRQHRYATLLLVPSGILLALLLPATLESLGGPDFQISALLAPLLVGGIFLGQWNGLAHYILRSHDQTRYLQRVWVTAGLGNVAANILLVPLFGIVGAAAATLVTFLYLEGSVFVRAQRFVRLTSAYEFRLGLHALAISLTAGALALGSLTILGESLWSLVSAAVVFLLAFLALAVVTRGLDRDDLALVYRIVRQPRDDTST